MKFHRKYAILKPVVFEVIQRQNPYLTSSTHQQFDQGEKRHFFFCFHFSSFPFKLWGKFFVLSLIISFPVIGVCSGNFLFPMERIILRMLITPDSKKDSSTVVSAGDEKLLTLVLPKPATPNASGIRMLRKYAA